jgi:hypothetical protein
MRASLCLPIGTVKALASSRSFRSYPTITPPQRAKNTGSWTTLTLLTLLSSSPLRASDQHICSPLVSMEALNLRSSTQVPIRRPALSPLHSLSSPHQLQQRSVSATPYNTPPRDKVKWLLFGRKGAGLKRASETGRNSCQPTELYDVRDYRGEVTEEDEQVVVPLAHNVWSICRCLLSLLQPPSRRRC